MALIVHHLLGGRPCGHSKSQGEAVPQTRCPVGNKIQTSHPYPSRLCKSRGEAAPQTRCAAGNKVPTSYRQMLPAAHPSACEGGGFFPLRLPSVAPIQQISQSQPHAFNGISMDQTVKGIQ
jgi:hypothetical protein